MHQNESFSKEESRLWYESTVQPVVPEWIHNTAQNLAFTIFNPDAVYRQLVSSIADIFLKNSLSVVSIKVIECAAEHQLEDLYRFNILRHNHWHNSVVWWMNKQVFMQGPLLIIHLTSPLETDDFFGLVGELKEKARKEKQATNRNLALLHTSDSWLDSVRESFIFLSPGEWLATTVAAWAIHQGKLEGWESNDICELQTALNYPVASLQLPLAMTNPTSGFFRNKRMWIGFAIAAGISLFNGLSHLYPVIPHIPVTRRFFSFQEAPLSLYGTIITAFYPFAIGIMFLMPLDVLFSTTLFYFLYRNEVALAKAVGWSSIPRFPYLNEQTIGAFVGLCFFFGWTGKRHFSAVLRSALPSRGREPPVEQQDEPMSYRTAVWGFVVGVLLFAFLLYKAGMAVWLALTFAVLFLITPLVTTRIRAESGIFVHAYHWQAPRYILNTILGTHRLGARNLTALSVCFFNRDYRPQQMPHQLEAFKIAELANINQRRMLLTVILATILGVIFALWVQLHFYYKFGADSGYFGPWALGYGREYFGRLTNWITYPLSTDWLGVIFIGIGFSVMMVLTYLRVKFFWLPLHPLGYVMASNQEMSDLWIPLLIALTLKWLILLHGGIQSYRRAIPFFLGLVLGDYLMGSTWSLLNILLNTTMYQFYP